MTRAGTVIVWGNCQAAPLAELLAPALGAVGLRVVRLPPVYLVTSDQLAQVHAAVRRCELLVSQPVADTYRVPGCSTAQLAALLPPSARLVTVPVLHQTAAFPFLSRGYDGSGERVDAPVTDYHDLRMVAAAERGDDVATTLDSWPAVTEALARAEAAACRSELVRRQRELDVPASDLLADAHRWWTMTHPHNAALAEVARRVLMHLDVAAAVDPPDREFLGERRAPVEPAVHAAAGVPGDPSRAEWTVAGAAVPLPELVEVQLAFYRSRPDVVAATLARAAGRAAWEEPAPIGKALSGPRVDDGRER